MQYRILGSSDLNVSVVSFGAWQIGDSAYWGANDETDAQRVIDAALDAGVNLFDTAEMYGKGESERVLGRVLGANRDRVYVASKVWPDKCTPVLLRQACEDSLQRLNTDRIDLYQIHWPPRDVPFADVFGEMARLRDEGRIRYVGVSNFGAQDLNAWMSAGDCVSNQLGYNLLFRAIEWEVVPACARHGCGVLAYMPLLQGILSGRWKTADEIPQLRRRTRHFSRDREGTRHGEPGCEGLTFTTLRELQRIADELGEPMANVALAWTIAQPDITSVIVGARRPDQLERNLDAARLTLSSDTLAALNAATQPLKEYFGRNADMWLTDSESRIR
ncbi:MAG: aldo/keto reductase [Candidatus Hydrogenedentes bacterium]|nr:aldo/keto reductase [Candidatus Hydrogenedentota bacterium]